MIYLATALFSAAERAYAAALTADIEALGACVYYPWRDAGDERLLARAGGDRSSVNREIVARNLRAIEAAGLVVAIVDGADVESGVAMELGYAHARGKRIKLLRTDFRTQGEGLGPINIMLSAITRDFYHAADALLASLQHEASAHVGLSASVFYDRIADEYGDETTHLVTAKCRAAEQQRTAEAMRGRQSAAILDLGCGDGRFLATLGTEHGTSTSTGVDASGEMLRWARQIAPRARLVRASCEQFLPFADSVFDLVHCAFMLDHVTALERCVAEIARVLKPDGRLLLCIHSPNQQFALRGGEDSFMVYRTAAGAVLRVPSRFGPLRRLPALLAPHFICERESVLPVGQDDLTLDYYELRKSAVI
jgi:SAM-dependent methyltransferase